MRIISGIYKGRHIRAPRNLKARPTTDFAKEGLFNILANRLDFEGLEVLDLFAGSGSISYEFASRGARMVISVEIDPQHYGFIRNTCNELDASNINVIKADAFRLLSRPNQHFDVVFADPPYDHPRLEELPDIVMDSGVLSDSGYFILEHPVSSYFNAHGSFQEHRKYGGVNFSFFKNSNL